MGQIVPDPIERYLRSLNRLSDPLLDEIEHHGETRDLPLIDPEVGALLYVLAAAIGARRILEIGTAIGYSSIWLARALPADGILITLEVDPERAKEARANLARAGLGDRANVMIGDAARTVAKLSGPFDMIFQDGDKHQYSPMLDRLVELLRPGGVFVTDNVLWNGEVVPEYVAEPRRPSSMTAAIAEYNQRLATDQRLRTSIVPLRDGVAISVKAL